MRVFGKVKSFDRTTGTGCALADSGAQAVFTSAALKPFGLCAIDDGVALCFELTLERGQLTVAQIYEIAGHGPHPGAARSSDKPPVPEPDQRVRGRVQWFDAAKGFGFVVSKDIVGDVLLHRSVLDAIGIDGIREGAVLEFDLVRKLKGPQITRIHAVLAPEQPLPPGFGVVPLSWSSISVTVDQDVVDKIKARQARKVDRGAAIPWDRHKGFGFIAREDEDDAPVWEEAVCRWFSRPKGFGFLRLVDGDEDIFVHMDLLRRSGICELRPGQRVRVETERTERGLMAVAVALVWDDDVGHA